jgi:hypothetical protein
VKQVKMVKMGARRINAVEQARPTARFLVPAMAAALALGCSGMNHNTTGGGATIDPLLGGAAIKATVPATPKAASSGPSASIPPVSPSPGSPASTAALAAGMTRPFDKDRDLRIAAPDANTGSEGWAQQGAAPAVATNGNGSGAVLRGIIPVSSSGTPQNIPGNGAPGAASAPAGTVSLPPQGAGSGLRLSSYEQAETLLKAHGALWYGLEMLGDTGEWKFSCIVPNRQRPGSRRTYEARDRNKLAAVQAVLDQIEKDQQ